MDADQFENLGSLGRGGMGAVFKARNRATGEVVAIKELHALFLDDPDYIARFEREVEVARRINSPNVVRVLGYGQHEGAPYMVMEYVEGQSLRDLLLERGRLSWDEARPVIAQVAEALRAAHKVGVIHRDVKPSNILLTREGIVKLADFGIARATDLTRLTGGATMLGTPAYMAPENKTSPQTDLYALGCVLYEMLAGRPPFEGESQQEILIKHLRERPDLNEVPLAARRVVGALLQKNPQRRPQSATALLMLLESEETLATATVVQSPPTSPTRPNAPPAPPASPGGPGGRARRPLWFALGGIGAAALLGMLFMLAPWSGGDAPASADDPSPSPTATRDTGGGPPQPTRPPRTATPTPSPTTPPAATPVVFTKNWSTRNARWGENVTIDLEYQAGDSPITQLVLRQTGTRASGGPVYLGPVTDTNTGDVYDWDGQNTLVWNVTTTARARDSFSFYFPCQSGQVYQSIIFFVFVDAKGRTTQTDLSVDWICSQTGR